jgi:molybdopterin converting factor small subunit
VHAGLDRFFPGAGRVRKIEIADGATVGSLLRDHGVPEDLPLVVGLNRDLGSRESELKPGDLVELVPPMTGG